MNRQKILFILHMPPPVHGAAMMGKYIHDSKVINRTFECEYINLTSAKTLQDIGKGGIGKYLKYFGLLGKVAWKVLNFRPKLVYVTPTACGVAFYKDFIVIQMLKVMRCQVVVHYHNKGVTTRQDKPLDDWMYRRFFRGVKVILLADALYEDVKKYVKREDVLICGNGIPSADGIGGINESIPTMRGEKKQTGEPKILFLSNLLIAKGVLVLLDALKILKNKGITFACDFVGAETNELDAQGFQEEVRKRGLEQNVRYLGKKYGEEKEEVYHDSDVFVLPTLNECFPLVLLEAMQYALPCVSTNEGGICSIIEDGATGYVVEKNNPKVLAQRMEALLEDKELRQRMGRNGYQKFLSEFTLNAFEERMKGCLENILSC